jgi:4-amino-4-deoxy-L-arabinose transferase-like glycosyltransferase
MSGLDPRLRQSLTRIVLIALAVRLVALGFLYPPRLSPDRDHYAFGFETGRIAHAIASGQGFSSPMPLPTGPTAWMAPVYPYFVAAIFRVWGSYSKSSALIILALQDFFSALTCLAIFQIGKKSFGTSVGLNAAWIWAFSPYAIYVSNHWVWETSLTTLLLAFLFLLTLRLDATTRVRDWLIYGLLWGVAALTNPAVLFVLPPLLVWLWWRHRARHVVLVRQMASTVGILCLIVAPWFVRNYLTFGRIIPFRSNFGAVLRMGNSDDLSSPRNDSLNPSENEEELTRFRQLGEMAYVAEKKQEAAEFIQSHPGTFAWLTLGRIVETWTGIWLPAPSYLFRSGWPAFKLINVLFCCSLSLLAFLGLRRAFRTKNPAFWPYVIVLAFFPLIYYATSSHIRFRHPIDPQIVLLAAIALTRQK